MARNRNHLRDRAKPMGVDVADAIRQLVEANGDLPIAIDRAMIVAKLIEIAQTDEEGIYQRPTGPAASAMTREFTWVLTKTVTFQAGYKLYGKQTNRPVVPVVDYFFQVVCGTTGADLGSVLEGMSDFDIVQSLPKRRGRVPVAENSEDYLRDEETGEVLVFGELVGLIVFPSNSRLPMLRAWLERRASVTVGAVNGTVQAIADARPGTATVESLKAAALSVQPAMTRALPSPRKKP